MSSRTTIADVASKAGVSTATVSRVINKSGPVSAETTVRVRAAIRELRYRPHPAARRLARQAASAIGLLLPEIRGDFLPTLLRGVEAGVRENGYDLLIHSAQRRPDGTSMYFLGEHNTDGLLIFTDSLDEAEMRRLSELQFPMVLLHRTPPADLDIPCVTFENKSGTRRLVEHLIEVHGYRRIGFLAGPPGNEDSYWREMGYREALAAHGIAYDPALVAIGGFSSTGAQAPIEHWLQSGVELHALFAGDDGTASGAITVMRNAGLRVPEDIAVVGFDDVPSSRYLSPPLTTVRAPIECAGREAINCLLALMDGQDVEPLVLLPTELIVRSSCGCA